MSHLTLLTPFTPLPPSNPSIPLDPQNHALLAVDEYQQVLADEEADIDTKLAAAEKVHPCLILSSMGI